MKENVQAWHKDVSASGNDTIKSGPGNVYGVVCAVAAGTPGLITIRDNGASGDKVFEQIITFTTAGVMPISLDLHGVACATDIYIAWTNVSDIDVYYE